MVIAPPTSDVIIMYYNMLDYSHLVIATVTTYIILYPCLHKPYN